MFFKMIVTVKQVPDTQQISGEAMTPEGTVNRGALPAITNPEDLNALEEALKIKERFGGEITVLTMGPPSAGEALKECYYRGADRVILLTDRKFAGADTLATSMTLAHAIRKCGPFHIIFCGRQAIDGDTAQVGPQLAEKMGINQITSVSSVRNVESEFMEVERKTEYGFEYLRSAYPLLLTIACEANQPRSPSAARLLGFSPMKFYPPDTPELERDIPDKLKSHSPSFQLWDASYVEQPDKTCGLKGSPTMVRNVESVVLETGEIVEVENSDEAITKLIRGLLEDHIL